jgi:bifunctional non-homologous end joining protein LigD
MLNEAMSSLKDPLIRSESFDTSRSDLIRAAKELGLEGVIAKRNDSLYEPGKCSEAWLKYRINRGQELVIGGYTPDNPFDALIVGYYQDGKLNYAAKVRNGFVPRVRREVFQAVKGLQIRTNTTVKHTIPDRA